MKRMIKMLAQMFAVVGMDAEAVLDFQVDYRIPGESVNNSLSYHFRGNARSGDLTITCVELNKQITINALKALELYTPLLVTATQFMDAIEENADDLFKVEEIS